jgi:hypothetical protein
MAKQASIAALEVLEHLAIVEELFVFTVAKLAE